MRFSLLLTLILAFVSQSLAFADEELATDYLPKTSVIYAELTEPSKIVDVILEHPLKERLLNLEPVKKAFSGKEMRELNAGLGYIETQIGISWQKGLKKLLEGGVTFAVDAKTQGVIILIKADDEQTVEDGVQLFIDIARHEASEKGKPDPIEEIDYRGISAYKVGKGIMAHHENWILLSNNKETAKWTADAMLDGSDETLSKNDRYLKAKKSVPANQSAWVYFDIESLRNGGVAKALYKEKVDNPVVEMVVGGILGALQKTDFATAFAKVEPTTIKASIGMPLPNDSIEEKRKYFFGENADGVAPSLIQSDSTMFTLSAYRDLSMMWLMSSDLFIDRIDAGFAKANATLTTLFSGKDFGEEILGSLGPQVQLIVDRQTFDGTSPVPAIKLPSFALIFNLKNPDEMRDDMRRTLQSLLGFLNVVGAQEENRPQLDIETEKKDGKQIIRSQFITPRGEENTKNAMIHYNFSPTFTFQGKHMILSSTNQLAENLSKQIDTADPKSNSKLNTQMALEVSHLVSTLRDNRNHLVAQTMLKEGKEKDVAELEFDLMTTLASWVENIDAKLNTSEEKIQLDFNLEISNAN